MIGCKLQIELDGQSFSFNSQKELDDFVARNFNRIKLALESGSSPVRFSKNPTNFEKQDEAMAKLLDYKMQKSAVTTFEIDGTKYEHIQTSVRNKKVQGVTSFINSLVDSTDKPIFTKFDVDNYVTVMTDRFTEKYKIEEGLSEEDARAKATDTIDKEVKSWPLISLLGTEIHTLASLFFDNDIKDADTLKKLYAATLNGGKHLLTPIVLGKLFDTFVKVRNDVINTTNDPNVKFITEVPIINEQAGLVGIVDLIAVTSDGFASVYDFKTSFKYADEQDRDKHKKHGYQLAFYKRLLEATGTPVTDVSIIPIKLGVVDEDFSRVTDIEIEEISSKIIELTDGNSDANIRTKSMITAPELEHLKFEDSGVIELEQKEFFGISPTEDLDAQVKRFKISKEGNKRYFFNGKDRTYLKELIVNPTTTEEKDANFLNERLNDTIIREHIIKLNSSKYENTANFKLALRRMIRDNAFDPKALVSNYVHDYAENLRNTENTFSHYVTGSFVILDIPELEAQGIIAFKNTVGDYIDFVAITTDQDLNQLIPLSKGRNLLGEFKSDRKVEKESYVMESNIANHLGIKILSVLNSNVALFNAHNLTINNIQIYSSTTTQQIPIIKSKLLSNYKLLLKESNRDYNLNGLKFTGAAQELLFATTTAIRRNDGAKVNANRILDSLFSIISDSKNNSNAKLVQDLRDIKRRFETELHISFNKPINFNSDLELTYAFLNKLIVELSSNKVEYVKDDMVKIGGSESTMFSAFHEIKNPVVQTALMPIRTAMGAMADEYIKLNNKFRPIFKKYYEAKNTSTLLGDHQLAFTNLYEKGPDGKIDKQFRFKNPEAFLHDNSYLDATEREFLTQILEELGLRMYGKMGIANAKLTGEYFNVPLKRASASSKFIEAGVGSVGTSIKHGWSNFVNSAIEENYLFDDVERSTFRERSADLQEMPNKFNSSKSASSRQRLLNEHDIVEFEKNLEAIFADVTYTDMKTNAYNNALPIVTATIVTSMLQQQKLGNYNLENTYQYIKDNIKATVYNEKLIEENQRQALKIGGAVKHAVSMLQLGMSPLNLVRETLQGQWATASKLMAKQYGEDTPSAQDYAWALSIIIGEGKEFLTNVTMTEEMNHMYRMAGMDVDQLAEKMMIAKTGLSQLSNRWWLWFMGAPDYLNRMAFLLAKMRKDGSYEAHSMVDGVLVYDWTKDNRFSVYASGDTSAPEYLTQRGKYLAYLEQFNKEARQAGTSVVDLKEGDALEKAYPTIERESIKSFVNYMHGPYDAEDKIMFNNTMFGVMIMQFRTWLLAKKQQYYLPSGRYTMGSFKHISNESGEKMYVHTDLNGERIINNDDTGTPLYDWEGRFMEGVWQSFMRVKDEIIHGDGFSGAWDMIRNDDNVKANLLMTAADLGFFLLVAVAMPAVIPWDELDDHSLLTALLNMVGQSAADLFFWTNIQSMVNPESMFPAITYLYKQVDGIIGLLTGSRDLSKFIAGSSGFTRTLDKTTTLFESTPD